MKRISFSLLYCLLAAVASFAQSAYDALAPFGFATCKSRTDAGSDKNITGGGCYSYPIPTDVASSKRVVTLLSNGKSMDSEIKNAITKNDIIVFDGSAGDFILKAYVTLSSLSSKTLIGINGATIRTEWQASEEDVAALEANGVSKMSTGSGGGTLPNNVTVKEQAEYWTRKIMIERYDNDYSEWWRKSGIFYITNSSNIIIRNIQFQGPGAMDLGGADLVSIINSSHHIWVDHCDFADGQDGNMDITNYSDFITVSWCSFHYTSHSYMHQNTNLCGSSDDKTGDDDKLDITWAYNHWGTGCNARMPMARYGRFHMLSNYFSCGGNKTSCINPRINSEFLIEGNFFDESIKKIYEESKATKIIWRSNNIYGSRVYSQLPETDDVTEAKTLIPYPYDTSLATDNVPAEVGEWAGATLFEVPTSISKTEQERSSSVHGEKNQDNKFFNLSGQNVNSSCKGIVIINGKKILKR